MKTPKQQFLDEKVRNAIDKITGMEFRGPYARGPYARGPYALAKVLKKENVHFSAAE